MIDFKNDLVGPFTVVLRRQKSGFFYTIIGCMGGKYLSCHTQSVPVARAFVAGLFWLQIGAWEAQPPKSTGSVEEY